MKKIIYPLLIAGMIASGCSKNLVDTQYQQQRKMEAVISHNKILGVPVKLNERGDYSGVLGNSSIYCRKFQKGESKGVIKVNEYARSELAREKCSTPKNEICEPLRVFKGKSLLTKISTLGDMLCIKVTLLKRE
jgi:hypothetical protein